MFGSITFKYFHVSTVMQLFKGSYFSVAAGLRHLCPNSAIANHGKGHNVSELHFTCFKAKYKKS